jgi:hypothetical protein
LSIRILLSIVAALAGTACASSRAVPSPVDPAPGERQKLVVERIRSGPQGTAFTDSARHVIRDARGWSRYRDALARAGSSGYAIDFDSRMVVIVALGRQSNTCCTIRVDSAIATSDEVAVFLTRSRLGDGCVVSAVVTHPFDAVRLPRRALPVRFDERELVTNCRRER